MTSAARQSIAIAGADVLPHTCSGRTEMSATRQTFNAADAQLRSDDVVAFRADSCVYRSRTSDSHWAPRG